MKLMICPLITLSPPRLVHADGRYQMLPLGDQMGIGAEKIVILDTVSGHHWSGLKISVERDRETCEILMTW